MSEDGTFRCERCNQPLNHTDLTCWKCGSDKIKDVRPQNVTVPVQQDHEPSIDDNILAALKTCEIAWFGINGEWKFFDKKNILGRGVGFGDAYSREALLMNRSTEDERAKRRSL